MNTLHPTKFVILVGYDGVIKGAHVNGEESFEGFIVTQKKDGSLIGRPVPILSTPDPELVDRIIRMQGAPTLA